MDIKNNKSRLPPEESQKERQVYHHFFLGLYAFGAVGCVGLYILIRNHAFAFQEHAESMMKRLSMGLTWCFIILFAGRFAEKTIRHRAATKSAGYNIIRVIRLLVFILLLLTAVSFVNSNWYTAAVSLGLISLILGFALQTPISSLIGWFYIIIRTPYKVGDRIQISTFTGDVVELGYLDTTLWEFAGEYMSNDLPSGRLIRFPNSMVFQSQVYNYSWNKFPYIWNEIPFHVAYESDLVYIETAIRDIAKKELDPDMAEKIKEFKNIVSETPVDELEIKEYPFVHFRINPNTWVEVLLIYLVEPKHSGATRSKLIKKILGELLSQPEKVMFPKSSSR